MPYGLLICVGALYSVMVPFVVERATALTELLLSLNHTNPSAPTATLSGWAFAVGAGYSVIVPDGVIFASLFADESCSANQRLPSGPSARPAGRGGGGAGGAS